MIEKQRIKFISFMSIFALILSLFSPFAAASAEEVKSVAEAIADNNGTATVEGYIVGTTANGPKYTHTGPFSVNTNLAIADSPSETDPSKILPVQLPNNSIRTELNLKDNPDHLGKKSKLQARLKHTFQSRA